MNTGDGKEKTRTLVQTIAAFIGALAAVAVVDALFFGICLLVWGENPNIRAFLIRCFWMVMGVFVFIGSGAVIWERWETRHRPDAEKREDTPGE
jgi:fatty acid desaturase